MTTQSVPTVSDANEDVRIDSSPEPVVRAEEICKTYGEGPLAYEALAPCSISLYPGELVVILGPSGSGKSTLLHLLSTIDVPTSGHVWLAQRRVDSMAERDLARVRACEIGFVLQRDNLIPSLRLDENVAAPLMLAGVSRREALVRAREVLDSVGLGAKVASFPGQVSGGEAQRAAIARACSARPSLIVADEPTGALDRANGAMVMDLLQQVTADGSAATLLVTHDQEYATRANRTFTIVDGHLRET
ncbi:MAG: ABC transporter ATP-binding protein [Ilumatobacteraceae bacterium]